ncbi:DUF4238 domain-containing protein [Streptomyces sp. NPDC005409]|uniref:DUF4238 domain-containing protein n=1 Tax=Streptomyces sp. NPDC005409 TaxID=3155342 RepID=UPI00345619AB
MNAAHISTQHLVSQVVLREFTMLGPGGGKLLPFDLQNPEWHQKRAGPGACGAAKDFVAIDSPAAENLWNSVETLVPDALAAVKAGRPFDDPQHVDVLRDLVVLHYVRSHRYRSVHTDAFKTVSDKVRSVVVERFPESLRREALRQTGLHLPGLGSLGSFAERLISQSEVTQDFRNGRLFRSSVEATFYKVRDMAAKWRVEVLTPESGQFLIGDTPAVTLRADVRPWSINMAFGDAQTVVLPIGPKYLLSLGPNDLTGTLSQTAVDDLNAVQIRAADRYVYMHPDSGLESFVRDQAHLYQ